MRYLELLNLGVLELARAGVTDAELDARILLEAATNKSRAELYLKANDPVGTKEHLKYLGFINKRKEREPVAYILGEREFWSLPFSVSPDVLIPRPETEFLLDKVFTVTENRNFSRGSLLDLCCGSGIIAIVLAKETGNAVVAADISSGALDMTQINIDRHTVYGKVSLVQGNLLEPFGQCFSLIVSNPPYVSRREVLQELEPEVAEYEPHLALDGGESGMELIDKIYQQLDGALMPEGQLFMEIGANQGDYVRNLFTSGTVGSLTFKRVEIFKDYSGRDRVIHAQRSAG